jgi:hypothetical protein
MMRSDGQQGAPVYKFVRRGGDGGPDSTIEETWSPVELVLESKLSSSLSGDFSQSATPEAAAEAAKQVKGRWKTYYAMRKSPMGIGLAGTPKMMSAVKEGAMGRAKEIHMGAGTNVHGANLNMEELGNNLEQMVRQQKLEDLAKLTPEQRVQRARDRAALSQKP